MFNSVFYSSGGVSFFLLSLFFFLVGSFLLFYQLIYLMDWCFFSFNGCLVVITLLFDWMSMFFIGSVLIISSMVLFYSDYYMSNDVSGLCFYYLVLSFIFFMVVMVISPNLVSILFGWDGLGLISYCLVIYYSNYSSCLGGLVTVLVNRLGDVCILLGAALMLGCGGWDFMFCFDYFGFGEVYLLILVVIASFTSSAQIPFSSWLPAAMAAPTPVSSLVHSSTLVTAGVYLLIRFFDWFISFPFMGVLLMVSLLTMFLSGLSACFEFDLSSIVALSTLSHLGLMISVLFLGDFVLCFFHLLVHAFFSALMFLCVGILIHCLGGCQDIRFVGGLVCYLPFTGSCLCISVLSMCGLPFMSGFYSSDLILESMMVSSFSFFVFGLFFISIGLTVSYSFRLMFFFLVFNVNYLVFRSYFEDGYGVFSLIFMSLFSVVGGSFLSKLFIFCPVFYFLPLSLKFMSLVFISSGFWLGYMISFPFMGWFVDSLVYHYFSGSMWFMFFFTSSAISLLGKAGGSTLLVLDSGWGEYLISMSGFMVGSFLSKLFIFFQLNNVSVYMLSSFFVFLVLFI